MATAQKHPAEEVLAQLRRILSSSHFSRSQALGKFLQFVVDLTLNAKQDELKEYRLGLDVFDRGADFDPRIDPIVRMQAAKVRSRLAEYYGSEGKSDPLVISIPKGGYVATFEARESPAALAATQQQADIHSIAVLPFVNMSSDPDNEYFSDGLTEELINLLTSVPGLRVVARTSAFSFKNVSADVREIGAKLKVQTVLEGSVRKAGDQLRVTAQLIEVATGYHLLSKTYPRQLKDIFAVQEELANAVVSGIMPKMRSDKLAPLLRVRAADLTAYNLYLRGMVTLSRGFHGPVESIGIFKQVLAIDPNYGPAFAGMAYAYFTAAWYGSMPTMEGVALAKSAAQSALRLDSSLGLGHTILGAIQAAFEWNWTESETSFERAIMLQPSLASAHRLSTLCLLPQRRFTEALSAVEHAIALDPFDAMLRSTTTNTYSMAGDYAAAIQTFLLGVAINPNNPLIYRAMGPAHQVRGNLQKAISEFRKGVEVSGRAPIALAAWGNASAEAGDIATAEACLKEVMSAAPQRALPIAILHLGLGRDVEFLEWFEKAIESREPYAILVPVDGRFKRMHENTRFQELLARMGLSTG